MSPCGPRAHRGRTGYCPACGLLVGSPAPPASAPPASTCPECGSAGDGGSFCERCGHPRAGTGPGTAVPAAGPEAQWVAVVAADRGLFDAVRAAERGFEFPALADRRIALTGARVRIGRPGRVVPEIDLSGPPPDPGVSHEHAELLRLDDGWLLHDRGSVNGTLVGGRRLAVGVPVRLAPGGRIRLGIWSRITLLRGP